jgi:hypothetical protein
MDASWLPRFCHHPFTGGRTDERSSGLVNATRETEARQTTPTRTRFNRCTGTSTRRKLRVSSLKASFGGQNYHRRGRLKAEARGGACEFRANPAFYGRIRGAPGAVAA